MQNAFSSNVCVSFRRCENNLLYFTNKMVEHIFQVALEYKERLRKCEFVSSFSYGRRMLRDDGDPNRFFLMYLFYVQSLAIQFLKDIDLLRIRCSVIPAVVIWRGPQIPLFLKVLVGGVNRGLLWSGVISLRLSSYGRGSNRLIPPTRSSMPDASHHTCNSCISSLTQIGRSAVFPVLTAPRDGPAFFPYLRNRVRPRKILIIFRLGVELFLFYCLTLPNTFFQHSSSPPLTAT